MDCAPIVIFTYNRLACLIQTVEALKVNSLVKNSDLIIYSDAPKNESAVDTVQKVRDYLKTINGFKSVKIVERDQNFGLEKSIIDGVTSVVNQYGSVIVLEDDLVTSPFFLEYMNSALSLYKDVLDVCQIMGYSYFEKYRDVFCLDELIFIRGADCLGWGTWSDRWALFNPDANWLYNQIAVRGLGYDFNVNNSYNYCKMLKLQSEGTINSWAIRWYASAFLNRLYTLYPSKSLVLHIGNDSTASNYDTGGSFDPLIVPLTNEKIEVKLLPVVEFDKNRKAYARFLKQFTPSLFQRVFKKFIKLLKV